ncbi:MAG TPA: DUF6134 family protein [Methylovirgula sp.]|nr:DUF6134 family protein [Methylovirgula sp.]
MLRKLTILLGVLATAAVPAVAQPAPPEKDRHVFDIFRDGSKIGTEVVEIDKNGDTTKIKFTTHISVVVMFIQAYHFDHSATETWSGGHFVSFKSSTDDNGTKHEVSAVAKKDAVDLVVDGKESEASADLVPASWWCTDFVTRTDVLNAETGQPASIKVTDLGEEPVVENGTTIQAHHYKVSGDINRDLWFDGDNLVRLKLLGSDHSTIVSDLAPDSEAAHSPDSEAAH